ncbi:hypothetical protein [Kitasatospora sp. MAP5-34]|uniref:hypothetical protein n=1 Tax=Kitasatospora sp. MAP5-34 TaxID=3035102 RepID=UPI0024736CCB|nr:hypothetical protein [Kitasatospora sp. MAP5-34]MDH6577134.1 hypothetical protein [Kitasatospora sp. MAP5-34]
MSRDDSTGLRAAQLRLGRLPGYVRQPDLARRNGEDGHTYKKGWEVRFTARNEQEIAEIREVVIAAGFAPARPFFKGHQLIQPVYGIAAVQAYLAAREAVEELARTRRSRPVGPTDPAAPGVPAPTVLPEQSHPERTHAEQRAAAASTASTASTAASAAASAASVAAASAVTAQRARCGAERSVGAPPAGRTA